MSKNTAILILNTSTFTSGWSRLDFGVRDASCCGVCRCVTSVMRVISLAVLSVVLADGASAQANDFAPYHSVSLKKPVLCGKHTHAATVRFMFGWGCGGGLICVGSLIGGGRSGSTAAAFTCG